jgi:hypothetical protein
MYIRHTQLTVSVVCTITGRQDNMVSLRGTGRVPNGGFGIADIQSVFAQFTVTIDGPWIGEWIY